VHDDAVAGTLFASGFSTFVRRHRHFVHALAFLPVLRLLKSMSNSYVPISLVEVYAWKRVDLAVLYSMLVLDL